MNETLTARQSQIVELLRRQPELTISDLAERLGISTALVQRAVRLLASAGLVVRNHDRVALPSFSAPLPTAGQSCALCGGTVRKRASFIIINRYGGVIWACCAHCGLLLLDRDPPVDIAFTYDFIQERTVDAKEANYVVESRVPACCAPSILSFASADDARSFQLGFGGTTMSFVELQTHLQGRMGVLSPCHACADPSAA
jgi:hypothetical protein